MCEVPAPTRFRLEQVGRWSGPRLRRAHFGEASFQTSADPRDFVLELERQRATVARTIYGGRLRHHRSRHPARRALSAGQEAMMHPSKPWKELTPAPSADGFGSVEDVSVTVPTATALSTRVGGLTLQPPLRARGPLRAIGASRKRQAREPLALCPLVAVPTAFPPHLAMIATHPAPCATPRVGGCLRDPAAVRLGTSAAADRLTIQTPLECSGRCRRTRQPHMPR